MKDAASPSSPSASLSDSSADVVMDAGSSSPGNQSDEGREELTNAAKFKAAQDLRIQTTNLPATPTTKERANSVGSATTTASGSSAEAKTPLPPSSTGKKRRRRTAAQIDRKFPCTYPGCTKAYGSEGSLTQHQRLKHRHQGPEPGGAGNPLSRFFLRTPRSLTTTLGHTTGPGGTRTVTIRPAGIDTTALPGLSVFDAATLVPENESVSGTFLVSSSAELMVGSSAFGHARQHLRARSNSMPVSYSSSSSSPPPYLTPPSPHPVATPSSQSTKATPSSQSTRRGRAAGTPRVKPPIRRTKSRSKSESMNELMGNFDFHTEDPMRPPTHARSASDSVSFPVVYGERSTSQSTADVDAGLQFSWRHAIAFAHTDSPPSSVEEAIDSDILSVLADCGDASDTGDSTRERGSTRSGSGSRMDEWFNQPDAMYLTTSLEKMTMMHESGAASPHAPHPRIKLEGFSDGTGHSPFPRVSIDSFIVNPLGPSSLLDADTNTHRRTPSATNTNAMIKHECIQPEATDQLVGHDLFACNHVGIKTEGAATKTASWTKELAALESYSSAALDQSDYMDVDSCSYGPMPWKTEKPKVSDFGSSTATTVDSLTAFLQHGDKNPGSFFPMGDAFTLDYNMEEARLSSPVVPPRNEL